MRDPSVKSYFAPFELNSCLGGGGVSKVLKSNAPGLAAGDICSGFIGWESYTQGPAALFQKIEPLEGVPLSYYLGVLGMPSETAYVGLMRLKELKPPQKGETVYISGAAGAVGQVCGQIAKRLGCFVVGSAGDEEKCDFVQQNCGYDVCFNYKKPPGGSMEAALAQVCPKGIDFYCALTGEGWAETSAPGLLTLFVKHTVENVGGETLEAAIENMNQEGRISVCGLISEYNSVYGGRKLAIG
jgi:NADPH-dependent curcumin reductase CurA